MYVHLNNNAHYCILGIIMYVHFNNKIPNNNLEVLSIIKIK